MNSQYLFVYGTLRRGERAAHLLESIQFICEGTIVGQLWRGSWFPMALRSTEPQERIHGEVFGPVTPRLLTRLDAYEGAGGDDPLYTRVVVKVTGPDGTYIPAWVYFYNGGTVGLTRIPSGNWLNRSAHSEAQ